MLFEIFDVIFIVMFVGISAVFSSYQMHARALKLNMGLKIWQLQHLEGWIK